MASARLGSYALCRASHADRAARRRAIASAADALALLRQLRFDARLARHLVHAAGVQPSRDPLHALATLLWRGTYVLLDQSGELRVPRLEIPTGEPESEAPEQTVAEEEDDGHPPAIVPPEYPRVAAYMMNGLYAALNEAERELEEQLFRGLPQMPNDQVPDAYRDIGGDEHLELGAAAHHATHALERLLHQEGDLPSPTSTLTDLYRELADTKRGQVGQTIVGLAGSLDRLTYAGDTDLAKAEGALHSNALPPALRQTTDVKVRGVRDSTEGAASRLDTLLYAGFEP